MNYLHDRKYSRANELAAALEERMLRNHHPGLAGNQPFSAETWDAQKSEIVALLDALAWAAAPTPDNRPDPSMLDRLPSGLVADLRRKERAGGDIASRLRRASQRLVSDGSQWGAEDDALILEITRTAEDEASDALKRMAEL